MKYMIALAALAACACAQQPAHQQQQQQPSGNDDSRNTRAAYPIAGAYPYIAGAPVAYTGHPATYMAAYQPIAYKSAFAAPFAPHVAAVPHAYASSPIAYAAQPIPQSAYVNAYKTVHV